MNLISFDVETWGMKPEYALQPWRALEGMAGITCFAIGWESDGRTKTTCTWMYDEPGTGRPRLTQFLEHAKREDAHIVCWNAPFDIAWCLAYPENRELVYANKWLDGALIYRRIINSPEKGLTTRLKAVVAQYLPKYAGYETNITFDPKNTAERERLMQYNRLDALFTRELTAKFLRGLSPIEQRNVRIEAACLPMVAGANLHGLRIHQDNLADLDTHLVKTTEAAYSELLATDPEIGTVNLNSPDQVAELLFKKWGLTPVKQTETGNDSTDKETLHELSLDYPPAKVLRTYREGLNNRTKFSTAIATSLAYNGAGVVRPQARVFGTYCVPGDVEVLTPTGWVRLDAWHGGEIMQVREDLTMEFLPATRFEGPVVSSWVAVAHQSLGCLFTHGHTIPYLSQKDEKWRTVQAGEWLNLGSAVRDLPVAGRANLHGAYTLEQMRVFAMTQADGSFCKARGRLKFTFKKKRKIERAKHLLRAAGVVYHEYVCAAYPERVELHIGVRRLPRWLTSDHKLLGAWILNTSFDALEAFVEELIYWDGSPSDSIAGVKYSSAIETNCDWVVTAAHLVGRKAGKSSQIDLRSRRTLYVTHIGASHLRPVRSIRGRHVSEVRHRGRAYCATTVTGYWLARCRGEIFITGNTGRMTYSGAQRKGKSRSKNDYPTGFALHQMKREALFRKVIAPPPGYTLVEFDFAGQEYRWMAVMSGDETMLAMCQPGEDAHAFMAAQIGAMDYKNLRAKVAAGDKQAKDLRQLGKVGNLSCQYRTSARRLRSVARVEHDIPMDEETAIRIHGIYRQTYPGVPQYWKKQKDECKHSRVVWTLAGRKVQLTGEWGWPLESTAINFPIQGVGGDQKYLALKVARNYLPRVEGRFYYELHDGLFFVVPDRYAEKAAAEMKVLLSNLPYKKAWDVQLPITFPVDAKLGPTWGELKEWKE